MKNRKLIYPKSGTICIEENVGDDLFGIEFLYTIPKTPSMKVKKKERKRRSWYLLKLKTYALKKRTVKEKKKKKALERDKTFA